MSALRRLGRALAIDLGPLRRHRDFRLLFVGQGVSLAGSMITYVAIPFQVYELTGSTLAVGLLGIVELAPLLATALLGGALADAHDRRRLVLIADTVLMLLALVLVANALLEEPQVWLLFVVAAGMSAAGGLQRPALDAMLPRLVPRDELAAASALDGFGGAAAQIAGPALGGLLIATLGLGTTYAIDAATFLVSLAALARMRAVPPPPEAAPPSIARIREGWRYARSRQELTGSYAVDINAMLFGIPVALFPAVADRYGGPEVLGLLYAAEPAGALLFTLVSGWVARVRRHGKAIALSAGAYGVAIVAFGVAGSLPLALGALAVAGGADMASVIFRQTLWNQTIPDGMRGRLAGIEQLSYSIGPYARDSARRARSRPSRASRSRSRPVAPPVSPARWSFAHSCRASGAMRPTRSVLEVAAVREHHADPGRVGRLDDLEVALGAARLDDRGHAGLDRQLRPVGEREERVGGERRALQVEPASRAFSIASRTESTRLICPAPIPTDASSRASTIALERTCLQTFQPNSISPHSASVGLRSVTTSISERSSRSMSRSCTSSPPITRLRSRSAMLKRRRSLSSRMRMFGLDSSSSSASSVKRGREEDLAELLRGAARRARGRRRG